MDIKQLLNENISKLNDEKEIMNFYNDILVFLYEVNKGYVNHLVKGKIYSEEKKNLDIEELTNNFKNIKGILEENIKLDLILIKSEKHDQLMKDFDIFKLRAKSNIEEVNKEVEKTRRTTINSTRKNLQITKDRLIGTANTTTRLGELLNEIGDPQNIEDTINNIMGGISEINKELIKLELWSEDEEQPLISNITINKSLTKPKKTTKKKKESDELTEEVLEQPKLI